MSKNIVLIGFMGSGKTTASRSLAEALKWPVVSTDELIVAAESRTIAQIFEEKGEEHFRGLEARAIESIADKTNSIIDCGGGVVLNPKNIELLKKNGVLFYLSATPDEIYKNVKNQAHRPLLNTPDPKGKIAELLAKRAPFYQKAADRTIDANGKTGSQVAQAILALFKK